MSLPAHTEAHLQALFRRAGERKIPLTVVLEVNHLCHLACTQCYLEDNHDARAEVMSLPEVCAVIDQLAAAGCLFLTLTGGEIFLRKDLLDIARHARSRGLVVRLLTSGTLLTPAIVAEIAALPPSAVEVTLYSLDPAVHDTITGVEGSQAKTLRGIDLCLSAGLRVMVKTPLMRANFDGYKAVRSFARARGAAFLCDPNITPRTDGDLAPTALRLTPEQLVDLYADGELAGSSRSCETEQPEPGGRPCSIAQRSCVISPSGDVYPCMEVRQVAGNVKRDGFAEIWRSSSVLERLRGIAYRDLDTCGGCGKAAYCGRCNGIAEKEEGDGRGPSTWACTMAAARESAVRGVPSVSEPAFVPLALLLRRRAER